MRFRNEEIPLAQAIAWIALSVIVVSGGLSFSWFYYLHHQEAKRVDVTYELRQMVIDGEGEVDPALIAKLLNVKEKDNLYRLKSGELKKKFLSFPLFKEGEVELVPPSTLYIAYQLRTPFFYLGDSANGAVDEEGVVFPPFPFFTPKNIPTVYFGGFTENPWGEKIDERSLSFAKEIALGLQEPFHLVKQIDLTRMDAPSDGGREVVVLIEETIESGIYPRLLRIAPENFATALARYRKLRPLLQKMENTHKIIDLRIESLAYIQEAKP